MAAMFASRPSSSAGYWRGGMSDGPLWQNQGSFAYGPNRQGVGVVPPGSGAAPSKAWSPTVIYLLVFVVLELIAVGCLERWLR
jgi:hypothetical protein